MIKLVLWRFIHKYVEP